MFMFSIYIYLIEVFFMHEEELQMQYAETRFFQLVRESYKGLLYWKKKEVELKQKLGLYLESLKEIYLDDKEKMAKIKTIEKGVANFYMPARWRGVMNSIEHDLSKCKTSENDLRYVLKMIDQNLKFEDTYLYKLSKEADFAQAYFENLAKLAGYMLKAIQESGEKLSKNRCDIKLLIVLYFYFRFTPAWFGDEIYAKQVGVIENITFPKAKIYEEFLEVFDAEKNSSDYWLNEEQFDKEFGRQHYENSLMNKFWQRICEYVVRQNKI